LLELLSFFLICDYEGIQKSRAANFELDIVSVFLDLHSWRKNKGISYIRAKWDLQGNAWINKDILHFASFLLAFNRKSLISLISRGWRNIKKNIHSPIDFIKILFKVMCRCVLTSHSQVKHVFIHIKKCSKVKRQTLLALLTIFFCDWFRLV